MLLTIDIETLPTNDPEVIASFADCIKAPATHKKPETIAAWMAENKDQALADSVAKTSFDGLYGRIACICYAFDDGEVHVATGDEAAMLEAFYAHVQIESGVEHHSGFANAPITLVGHNIAGFDLPFLKHRSIILGVKPYAPILKAMNAKPWDACIADTMLLWSSDPHKRGSMDRLCKAFGFAGKGDFDGSMVAATWPVDPQRVIDYCKDDVRRTRAMYKRITFQPYAYTAKKLEAA